MIRNLKNIFLYTFTSFFAKSFAVLIIPLIAHNLSVEEYGNYIIIISIIMLVQSIYLFGFEHSLNYYFNKFKSNLNKKILVSTQLLFILLICFITFIPIILFFNSKIENLNLILLWGFVSVLLAYFSSLLKVDMQASTFVKSQIVQSIVLLLTIYVLLNFNYLNIQGIIFANILSITLSLVFMSFFIKKYILFSFNFNLLKKILHYGLPLMPAAIILWGSTQLDRYYILYFLNEYILGIYGFTISIGMIAMLLKTAFKSAIDPFIMNSYHTKSLYTKRYISIFFTLSLYIFAFLFLTVSIFSDEIVLLIGGKKYLESISYIPWVLFIVSITTINQYFIYGINFKRTNKLILKGLIFMLVVNVTLAYLLINILDVYGIIISNLFANIVYSTYLHNQSNKLYPIKYHTGVNIFIVFTALSCLLMNNMYLQDIPKIFIICIFVLLNVKVYTIAKGLLNESN
jgi:O-antigen/teichoic acid export membrane protein